MSNNLNLWNSVCKTDPRYTKKANVKGNNLTSICPQYQRMMATEKFGYFGLGWGVKDEKFDIINLNDGTVLGSYNALFYYGDEESKRGEFPICSNITIAYTTSTGKYRVDDNWMKKAQTDALTKGLSMLGFNADVFLGKFDDFKYVNQLEAEEKLNEIKSQSEIIAQAEKDVSEIKSIPELNALWGTLAPNIQQELKPKFAEKKNDLQS